MKLVKRKEETINITWEHGRNTELFAVVYRGYGVRGSVIALFDSAYWANTFVNSATIKENLTVMEVKR